MSSVSTLKEYLQSLEEKGHGDYSVYLGTRALDDLRPYGKPVILSRPYMGDEIANDGSPRAFIRAEYCPVKRCKVKMLDTFRAGQSTDDVRKTKLRAIYALVATPSVLGLYSVIKAYFPDFPIDVEDVAALCTVFASLVGIVSHIISTKTIGVQRANLGVSMPQHRTDNDDHG